MKFEASWSILASSLLPDMRLLRLSDSPRGCDNDSISQYSIAIMLRVQVGRAVSEKFQASSIRICSSGVRIHGPFPPKLRSRNLSSFKPLLDLAQPARLVDVALRLDKFQIVLVTVLVYDRRRRDELP